MNKLKTHSFAAKLLKWQKNNGRNNLPWQESFNPYCIWLSEIMLQQTQVQTVIPYYKRFIERFPTLEKLAISSLDEVLAHWSGLGFYTRARNLHRTANIILEDHQGIFPQSNNELYALPGIGKTTAHAIYSLAYNKRAAILDGNVKRVLIRYFKLFTHPNEQSAQKTLWDHAEMLLPNENYRSYTQSMMDLGALICTPKKPKCASCPVAKGCQAYENDLANTLPLRKHTNTKPTKEAYFLLMQSRGQILLEKRPLKGIWGGLWSLPQFEKEKDLKELTSKLTTKCISSLPSFKHTFSHYHLLLNPIRILLNKRPLELKQFSGELSWYKKEELLDLGLPKPIRDILTPL